MAVSKLVDDAGRSALLATLHRVNAARTWVAANRPIVPGNDHVKPNSFGNLVQLRDKTRASARGN